MRSVEEYNACGRELENLLVLRYAPIAFKLIEREEDIPSDALRPKRDLNCHLAMCQALAMVRRQRKSLVMLAEDHWCVWPVIGFGLRPFDESVEGYDRAVTANFIEDPAKAREFFKSSYPRLEVGKYIGFAVAPLDTASFVPDLVIIYAKPAQLRSMLMSAKYKTGELLQCGFDSIDSCVYSTITPIKTGNYNITVPDPGEYERALTDEDEMIFSVPAARLPDFLEGLKTIAGHGFGYKQLFMEMKTDFPRPEFYDDLSGTWGLDRGEIWSRR